MEQALGHDPVVLAHEHLHYDHGLGCEQLMALKNGLWVGEPAEQPSALQDEGYLQDLEQGSRWGQVEPQEVGLEQPVEGGAATASPSAWRASSPASRT